jgi:hypothetical protein
MIMMIMTCNMNIYGGLFKGISRSREEERKGY